MTGDSCALTHLFQKWVHELTADPMRTSHSCDDSTPSIIHGCVHFKLPHQSDPVSTRFRPTTSPITAPSNGIQQNSVEEGMLAGTVSVAMSLLKSEGSETLYCALSPACQTGDSTATYSAGEQRDGHQHSRITPEICQRMKQLLCDLSQGTEACTLTCCNLVICTTVTNSSLLQITAGLHYVTEGAYDHLKMSHLKKYFLQGLRNWRLEE